MRGRHGARKVRKTFRCGERKRTSRTYRMTDSPTLPDNGKYWLRPVLEPNTWNLPSCQSISDPVFTSQRQQPYTRFGVYRLVERCKAAVPSLSNRRVTPHVIRHTCACHLLRSGVDLNTIRAWLGHVNLDTTNIYAQVDLDLKIRAMQQCDTVATQPRKVWKQDQGLMEFLDSL